MKEIQLNKGMVALVDDDDFERINKYKWQAYKKRHVWYAKNVKRKDKKRIVVKMHHFILNQVSETIIDHKNRIGIDNRKDNLRICTSQQNTQNSRIRKTNTSGYKGVSLSKKNQKYRCNITINYKAFCFGEYTSAIAAATVYDFFAYKLHGEFAGLNFMDSIFVERQTV